MRCAVVNTQHSGPEFAPATACFNSLIELQADLDALLKLP
jgi:hypothetical protein